MMLVKQRCYESWSKIQHPAGGHQDSDGSSDKTHADGFAGVAAGG